MGMSSATNQITQALRNIAEEYAFGFKREQRYFPYLGRQSERVDVQFTIPGGRPVLRFEIDNNPGRAALNRLKIFGNPYVLSTLPVVALAVYHGPAAIAPLAFPRELLCEGYVLPPRFLDTVTVDNSSPETIETDLRTWLQKLILEFSTSPKWGTVLDIAEQYQPLLSNLSLDIAAAHLDMHAELAWFLAKNHRLPRERAACLSISLARMLQRAGYHSRARDCLRLFRQRVPDVRSLSEDTDDDARSVEFLLSTPSFDDRDALAHLSSATENLRAHYHRSKFHWRKAIPLVLRGDASRANDVIDSYLDGMGGSMTAKSNEALLRAIYSLTLGKGDPREHAATYRRYERYLLAQQDGADGTVHGVVSSLYLTVIANLHCGNVKAGELIPKIDAFCQVAGVPPTADGLREIRNVLPNVNSQESMVPPPSQTLPALISTKRSVALNRLCIEVDFVCP